MSCWTLNQGQPKPKEIKPIKTLQNVRHEINSTLLFFDVPKSVREKALHHLDDLVTELQQRKQNYEAEIKKTDSDMWKEIHAQVAFEIGRILEVSG